MVDGQKEVKLTINIKNEKKGKSIDQKLAIFINWKFLFHQIPLFFSFSLSK